MHYVDCRSRLVQVTAVLLLTFSAYVQADNCAGGMDVTGNVCNGDQAEQRAAATEPHLLYLQGAAAMASLRLERAKQRQAEAATVVKEGDAELKAALLALRDAEKAAGAARLVLK